MSDLITESFVRFYPLTNVANIKITNDVTKNIEEAVSGTTSTGGVKNDMYEMDTDTALLTKYSEEQLDASYFAMNEEGGGTVFVVYRKVPNQNYYTYLCTSSNGNYKFTDYNVKSNEFYHYLVSVEQLNSVDNGGIAYITYENLDPQNNENYMHTVFDGWSICDIESSDEDNVYIKTGRMWNLGLNLQDESISTNVNIATWDTLGRYPKFSIGKRKYKNMTFTGLLGKMEEYDLYSYSPNEDVNVSKASINKIYRYTEKLEKYNSSAIDNSGTRQDERWGVWDPYANEIDKLTSWDEFITNGKLKLLRDTKGNSWIVQVTDSINSSINSTATTQPTTISFQWKEAMGTSDVAIVVFGDTTETGD